MQRQEEPTADTDDPEWTKKLVDRVAEGMGNPIFEARANDGCRTCPVRSCCPVHDEGGQVGWDRLEDYLTTSPGATR